MSKKGNIFRSDAHEPVVSLAGVTLLVLPLDVRPLRADRPEDDTGSREVEPASLMIGII